MMKPSPLGTVETLGNDFKISVKQIFKTIDRDGDK